MCPHAKLYILLCSLPVCTHHFPETEIMIKPTHIFNYFPCLFCTIDNRALHRAKASVMSVFFQSETNLFLNSEYSSVEQRTVLLHCMHTVFTATSVKQLTAVHRNILIEVSSAYEIEASKTNTFLWYESNIIRHIFTHDNAVIYRGSFCSSVEKHFAFSPTLHVVSSHDLSLSLFVFFFHFFFFNMWSDRQPRSWQVQVKADCHL